MLCANVVRLLEFSVAPEASRSAGVGASHGTLKIRHRSYLTYGT